MKLKSVTVRCFRSFAATEQTLECDAPLTLVYGSNSHGKTSLAEAFEFLLSGRTSRLQVHEGAKIEFEGCLRNVYAPTGEAAWVEAVIETGDGEHALRRTLDQDLDQKGACASTLTLDGKTVADAGAVGIALSTAPFETPVLMQHALRFVLSARPQSRSDYVKAVLDVGDLDDVRQAVASTLSGLAAPSSPALTEWETCAGREDFGSILQRADKASTGSLREHLVEAICHVVPGAPAAGELTELVTYVEGERARRKKAVFPLNEFEPAPIGAVRPPQLDSVERLATAQPLGEAESPAVIALLQAAVAHPDLAAADKALDCPLCLTHDALTVERLAEIRDYLSNRGERQRLHQDAQRELASVATLATELRRSLKTFLPKALNWDEELKRKRIEVAVQLLEQAGKSFVEEALDAADDLSASHAATMTAVDQLEATHRAMEAAVQSGGVVNVSGLKEALTGVFVALDALQARVAAYATGLEPMAEAFGAVLDQIPSTKGWSELLGLSGCYEAVPAEVVRRKVSERLSKEAATALRQIEKARKAVLDANFEKLSSEVVRWWNLLRPDEPIRFTGLQRRGEGLRFLDLKAALGLGNDAAVRHAAGVFSDSQLNALGLALFLARALRDRHAFIVLDDPVPASDEEHRSTFAQQVLGELIELGTVQTIVTTHDGNLSKRIHDLHQHRGIGGYRLTLDEPSCGSVLTKETDDLQRLISEASDFAKNPTVATLPEAARRTRIAAERLCKEIIVRNRRAAGELISVADLTETLGPLISEATPFLCKDPSHPGKLKHAGTVLNPASHDDPAQPSKQDLKTVVGDLRTLRANYCKQGSLLVHPSSK